MRAYVLAGGASRRMGRPKFALPFLGTTFLDRVIEAARPVFDEVVVVTRCDQPLNVESTRTIEESAHEGTSPLFGIAAALADAKDAAWILGVDYPSITADVLTFLLERFREERPDLLVPIWSGKPQLLCGAYALGLRDEIDRRLAAGEFKLRGLIDFGRTVTVAEEDLRSRFSGEPLRNVNTPEEYEEILSGAGESDRSVQHERSLTPE